jgi:hypothetical protein
VAVRAGAGFRVAVGVAVLVSEGIAVLVIEGVGVLVMEGVGVLVAVAAPPVTVTVAASLSQPSSGPHPGAKVPTFT